MPHLRRIADGVARVPSPLDSLSDVRILRTDGPPVADLAKPPLRTILDFLYSLCTFMPNVSARVLGRVRHTTVPVAATRLEEEEKVQECWTADSGPGRQRNFNALMRSAADVRILSDPVARVPGRAA